MQSKLFLLLSLGAAFARGAEAPGGDAVLRAKAGRSEIVTTTTRRLAGAIHSLTWDGKEFIDSSDHGRQLQSASSFDCGGSQPFWAEQFNPTEAGSRRDGSGPTSSSRLVSLSTSGPELRTVTQMAFWLAPGEDSSGRAALNTNILSCHLLEKCVRIGFQDLAQVIEYQVTFKIPPGESHRYAQFEALTGYMPAEFGSFYRFSPATGKLEPLDDGPGEQAFPVVLATASGSHAMGIFSPDQPSKGYEQAGYGRFRFPAEKVTKWNCVFRVRDAAAIPPRDYSFRMFVAVGNVEEVRGMLQRLSAMFTPRTRSSQQ